MCQAYAAEARFVQWMENMASKSGFRAALAGKPKTANPYRGAFSRLEEKAWDHGWECFQQRLVPWAIEREINSYFRREQTRVMFKNKGRLPAYVKL